MNLKRFIFPIIVILFGFLYYATNSLINHWCNIFTCSYISWNTISERINLNMRNNYRLESLAAYPSEDYEINELVPKELLIYSNYTFIVPDDSVYPMKSDKFYDTNIPLKNDFIYILGHYEQMTSNWLPTIESQQRFKNVKISPREIYNQTWEMAYTRLGKDIKNNYIAAVLLLDDEVIKKYYCESVWELRFLRKTDMKFILEYAIDAQTGAFISETII